MRALSHRLIFAGEVFVALSSGALFFPQQRLLLVADLHFEKGSAYARSGQFLPPYDSRATLNQLEQDIAHCHPDKVICLGDSFHDPDGPNRLNEQDLATLQNLISGRNWIWITGNHDPAVPAYLGGRVLDADSLQTLTGPIDLCHEPSIEDHAFPVFQICGHLHPVAEIPTRGRRLRRRCFLVSNDRIIMPAYGAYTGGLSVAAPAFDAFRKADSRLIVIGRQTMTEQPLYTKGRR